MRRIAGLSLVLVLALSSVPAAAGGNDGWKGFRSDRERFLEELAPAFVDCFARRDSLIDPLSPVFHGCLDWHSAVHAAYSHYVLYRRTGDDKFLDLVDAQMAPQGVSLIPAEQVYQRTKAQETVLGERPYGFGWFLILARERERALGEVDPDVRDMADLAASEVAAWLEARRTNGDAETYILNRAHANYSWSLINLDVWARYTKDAELLDSVRAASEPLFDKGLDARCSIDLDRSPTASGFQPACLMRLAAVAHIWGKHVRGWVAKRLPNRLHIDPVTEPSGCHAGGLNFTRAFALYQLHLLTGQKRYRDNYAELIRYHVGRPDLYTGASYVGNPSYDCYSHWVAQMGVRAISLSYEPPPETPRSKPPGS